MSAWEIAKLFARAIEILAIVALVSVALFLLGAQDPLP